MPRRMGRRLPRILPIAATAVSLALWLTTTALWVRSQWVADIWRAYSVERTSTPVRAREFAVATYGGTLAVRIARDTFALPNHDFLKADAFAPWDASTLPRDESWSHRASPRSADRFPFDIAPGPLGFLWDRVAMHRPDPSNPNGERIEEGYAGSSMIIISTIKGRRYATEREYTAFGLPWWTLSLLFAIRPATVLRHHFTRRRHPVGRCPSCGYDLRATPTRCPECGTVTAPAT
jgi:hypothetical protein